MKQSSNRRKPPRASKASRHTAKGREIIASLTEAVSVARRGIPIQSRFTVRMVEMPAAPAEYDAGSVRATRDAIGVSQAVFANLLGVSPVLVRAWEQSQRVPAKWARRLLDEVNRDPRHWRGMLRQAS